MNIMDYWLNKIAVVTGGSSGIGAQITVDLANKGMHVISVARRKDRIEKLANQNANASGRIYARECDVSNKESIKCLFKWIDDTFGKVHVLVNNAGLAYQAGLFDLDKDHDKYTNLIDVNVTAVVVCTREAYRLMAKHEENAYIININSILGHKSISERSLKMNIYAATKHAITSLSETMRLDFACKDVKRIRVTSISPGIVKTEAMVASGATVDQAEQALKRLPHLQPSDISNAVLYVLGLPQNINVSELTILSTGEK